VWPDTWLRACTKHVNVLAAACQLLLALRLVPALGRLERRMQFVDPPDRGPCCYSMSGGQTK